MIFAIALLATAISAGIVYAALWGLLMEHIRISTEPQDDSRYNLEE